MDNLKRCQRCGDSYLNFHECEAVIDLTKKTNVALLGFTCYFCAQQFLGNENYVIRSTTCDPKAYPVCDGCHDKIGVEAVVKQIKEHDPVNHPKHYTSHPSGIECIDVVEHLNFCRGNAIKYIWRAGEKGKEIEDLEKAAWYIQREIERLEKSCAPDKAKP